MVSGNERYQVGDSIVYPGHGVGIVEAVVKKKIAGSAEEFIQIVLCDSKATVIFVPARQASSVGLRKILSNAEVEEVYKILRNRDVKFTEKTWNRRYRDYAQKINTGSLYEIAEVIRDLVTISATKELSFGEKRMLESAENLLIAEIALVKARSEENVREEIQDLVACNA